MRIVFSILIIILKGNVVLSQGEEQSTYTAGESIIIHHSGKTDSHLLKITHSFGSTILSGEDGANGTTYKIPKVITRKTGTIDLEILKNESVVWRKKVTIKADVDNELMMESYCGPKHLIVSRNDFSMITSSVLDQYDNPLPKGTPLEVNCLIENKLQKNVIKTQHLLGFDKVFATRHSGYGSVSTSYDKVGSKEFRLDFYANSPSDYQISIERQHTYADGNQLVNIVTSEIKDEFGNRVENGTLIYFSIEDSDRRITQGTSETINGKAIFQIPAPEKATVWTVKSTIPGYAQSNILSLSFKESVKDFTVQQVSQAIKAGPIKGFMGQFIREGTMVTFILKNNNRTIRKEIATKGGIAIFDFHQQFTPSGSYHVEVQLGSIIKTLNAEVK